MYSRSIKQTMAIGLAAALAVAVTPKAGLAQVSVDPGFDLFKSIQPTLFGGSAWEGVPLGDFDFGSGPAATGNTDTIVERIDPATVPGSGLPDTAAPIPIELVALQLRSVTPIDLDGPGPDPLDFHFITLDPINLSTGSMTITFDSPNGGTFDSFINVDFDIRVGAINGPVVFSDILQLGSSGTPWDRTAPPDSLLIPGVNDLLNGVDNGADFHPGFIIGPGPSGIKSFTEVHPAGAKHTVQTAFIPEPSTPLLLALGGLMLASRRRHVR